MSQINYQTFYPSLVGLKTNRNKGLAGVRVSNVRVKFQSFDEAILAHKKVYVRKPSQLFL